VSWPVVQTIKNVSSIQDGSPYYTLCNVNLSYQFRIEGYKTSGPFVSDSFFSHRSKSCLTTTSRDTVTSSRSRILKGLIKPSRIWTRRRWPSETYNTDFEQATTLHPMLSNLMHSPIHIDTEQLYELVASLRVTLL
jgi:hypothetical protein